METGAAAASDVKSEPTAAAAASDIKIPTRRSTRTLKRSKVDFVPTISPRKRVSKKRKVEFADSPATSSPGSTRYQRSRVTSVTPASSPLKSPFNLPPSQMTKAAFHFVNPFVTVRYSSSLFVKDDPFLDPERHMDQEALRAAIDGITVSAPVAVLASKNPSRELGGRAFHLSLASDFWRITRQAPKLPPRSLREVMNSDIGLTGDGHYDLDVDIQMAVTHELRKTLQDDTFEYEDGCYLQGLLYINEKSYPLPDFTGEESPQGCLKFFEGNIRILVGDRVLDWTKADVETAIEIRNKQVRDVKSNFMNQLFGVN